MIENLEEKLHQGKRKNSKGEKICVSIIWELEWQKYPKSNYQTNTQHFSNPEHIFKSAKNFLEKRNPIEDSSKTIICKVLSKISNRKKTSKQQYNFYKAKISLEVYGM